MKNKNIHLLLIFLGTIFYFVANFQRIAIPGAVFDLLEQALNVTAPYITAMGAIFMYIYALGQLIIGVLVDRYGGFKVMLAGGIILTLGCILFPITTILPIMYISRAFIGLGASCFYLSMIKELKNIISDKNFGLAISVMLFIGYCGGIVANAPFVAAMKYMSWRSILLIIGIITLVTLLVFVFVLNKIQLPAPDKHVKLRMLPFRLVLHKKHNRNLFNFACCNFGISYVIQTVIGKKFLEDFCNYPVKKAAIVLSMMAVIGAIFNIVNATTCKICRNKRVLFLKVASVITFLCLLSITLLIYFDIRNILISVVFCIIAANASLTSLLVPVLHLTNRKMVSGTAVSIMNFCFFMMVGILGTLTGFVLHVFEPTRIGDTLVYNPKSYLLLFFLFLCLSIFEMYKAMKMSNKY